MNSHPQPARYFVALFLLFAFGALRAADDPALLASVRQQIDQLLAEKHARTQTQRKIGSSLLDAERQHRLGRASDSVPSLRSSVEPDSAGTVMVDLNADVSPELLGELSRMGGTILTSHARGRSIRARLPLATIQTIAERNDVRSIKSAARCVTNADPFHSEGDVAHRADRARNEFGVTGQGVKVGVLSDSVDHLSTSQIRGRLPIVHILPGQGRTGRGEAGEGTAMLEIVHDLAPGAELFFATAFSDETGFAQNIRDLAAAGCSVIIDDVSYFSESPFQDGVIARAVNDVSAQGVLYFSCARNSGNKDDNRSGTWEGDFVDGGKAGRRDGRFHDFGNGTVFNLVRPGGSERRVDLFWADPLGAASDDYDLFVVDRQGHVIRQSSDTQDGDDDPYESIDRLFAGERIAIAKFAGEARFLHLDTGRGVLAISTAGNVRGHNASGADNAFCIAATKALGRTTPFNGGMSNPVEFFSSDGFRRMFFDPDGVPFTPGDFSSTGGKVLMKPELTAADGVHTSVRGFEHFFGTSAAAPHAGAIAALLKSFKPNLTPAQIRDALQSTAQDIEAPGFDRDSGFGIINAQAALQAVAAMPGTKPVLVPSNTIVTFTENASPVSIAPELTINDSDSIDFRGGTLSVAIIANGEDQDVLGIRSAGFNPGQVATSGKFILFGGQPIGSFTGGGAGTPLVITFNSTNATPATITALARSITFSNTSDNPSAAERTIGFLLKDGDGETSVPATQKVQVNPVNDAPSFAKGPDQIVTSEIATSIPGWATNLSAGPADESGQMLSFQVSNNNAALFTTEPSVSADGTLTYQIAPAAVGTATVSVQIHDDGDASGDGISPTQTFRIFVNLPNFPPSFTIGPDITIATNAPAFSQLNWATHILPGPANEAAQQVHFLVMSDNPALFTTSPAVAVNGTLTFTPAPNASGIAHVIVRAQDDAGVLNGSIDTSDPQQFTITIASFSEEIGIYNGLIHPTDNSPREFARYGLARATVSRTGALSAKIFIGGMPFALKGDVASTGDVTFGPDHLPAAILGRPGQSPVTLALHLDTTQGSDRLFGTIVNGNAPFSNLNADRAPLNPSTALIGNYTAAFRAKTPAEQKLDASQFPQGDGIAVIKVSAQGSARLVGRLADGSNISYANTLSKDGTLPMHLLTDANQGSLTGTVAFQSVPQVGDLGAHNLIWFKPQNPRTIIYPIGWTNGILVDLIGSRFAGSPIFPDIAPASTAGNLRLTLSDGGFGSPVSKRVNINVRDHFTVLDRDDDQLRLQMDRKTGVFAGFFFNPLTSQPVFTLGVVLQAQKMGTGFFVNLGESGSVSLVPPQP